MNPRIRSALFFAGLIVAAAFALRWAEGASLVDASSDRASGVMMGLVLAWFGNLTPKQVTGGCGAPAVGQCSEFRRFAGKMFVLAGSAYAIVWIVTPIAFASELAIATIMIPFLIVLFRGLRRRFAG